MVGLRACANRRARVWRAAVCALFAVFCLRADAQAPAAPASTPAQALTPAQVVAHLNATVTWFHRIQAVEQQSTLAGDVVYRDRLQQTSTTALRLAFAFARAAATLINPPPNAAAGSQGTPGAGAAVPANGFDRQVARIGQRIADLQARLATLDRGLARATPAARATLTAERDRVSAALALARDVQTTMENLARFAATSSAAASAGTGLAGQINELERSVPEALSPPSSKSSSAGASNQPASAARPPTTASTAAFRPERAGLIGLVAGLFTIEDNRRQLDDALRATDVLLKETREARGPLVLQIREFVASTDPGGVQPASPAQTAQATRDLLASSARFKLLSTALVPIGEQGISIETSRSTLVEWRAIVSQRLGTTLWYVLLRGGILIVALVILFLFSEMWRRATFRYLHDVRRRGQFLVLRRVVIGFAVALILIFGLVSQIGSVATYAGFVTAGVAVAMQNVILAVAGYFFLIGRYGVRVGDRITLAGVTGKVVDISLVRIYLMELAGPDLRPTGRISVLSNAVLFQPSALFKQLPGADYIWHAITVMVAAGPELTSVEDRVKAAAESVYDDYRSSIEQQHATMQRFVEMETSVPTPDVRAHLTAAGIECLVRYPVDVQRAARTDRDMLDAIRQAIAAEPTLTLLSTTRASLQQGM
ncbi:MAG TPA: mechanosensitive ion channel family protein [Vicinamibacterales bacterium]